MAARPAARDPDRDMNERAADRATRYVFAVTLLDEHGAEWEAIGGGATVNEALAFAVASAPAGRAWHPAYWVELYAD